MHIFYGITGLQSHLSGSLTLCVNALAINSCCFLNNKVAPRANNLSHKELKYIFSLTQGSLVSQSDPTKCTMGSIHCCLSKLIGVHFAEALVTLDRFFPRSTCLPKSGKLAVKFLF